MARPLKEGLDYFPLDVNLDDKFEIIESEFGISGFGIIIKLFMRIYGEHGYYTLMTLREQKLLARRINVDINLVNEVIMLAITENIFDKGIFEKYGVLTSRGIQKRYLEAAERRKKIGLEEKILLINVSKMGKIGLINVDINLINVDIMQTPCIHDVDINSVNSYKSTQSKVKESNSSSSKDEPENLNNENDNQEGEDEKLNTEKNSVFYFYQNNIGLLSPHQAEEIGTYLDDGIECDLIIEAIKDSLGSNNKYKYLLGILNNCVQQGINTLDKYNARKVEHENKSKMKERNNHAGYSKHNTDGNGESISGIGIDLSELWRE